MTHSRLMRGAAAAAVSLAFLTAPVLAQEETAADPLAEVIATVDGRDVTLGELAMMRGDLPQQYQQLPIEQLVDALLQRVAVEAALSKKAIEDGLEDDPDVKLRAAVQRRGLLAEAYMREVVEGAVTDEKIAAAYEEAKETLEPVQEVKASHILVSEKEKAEELMAELEGGADFAELAKEHGTDGTKERGGDLGWFVKEQMVPEFADAAFEGDEGAYVGPVQTQFGWHLIHVTGKREKPVPTLEEMRPELARQITDAAATAEIEAARASVEIVRREQPVPTEPADEAEAAEGEEETAPATE